MRFILNDDQVSSSLLTAPRHEHTAAHVLGADAGGAAAGLRDFVEGFRPGDTASLLERLRLALATTKQSPVRPIRTTRSSSRRLALIGSAELP
jgi:hypothetical protein